MSDATPPIETENRFGLKRPKVPPFARYKGTSAWRKYKVRVKEYAAYRAKTKAAAAHAEAAPAHAI